MCNDFTHIGTTGRSVVDYVIMPYEKINRFDQFDVVRMSKMMDLVEMKVERPPDHSMVMWCMDLEGIIEANIDKENENVLIAKGKNMTVTIFLIHFCKMVIRYSSYMPQ